jgi:glutamate carboxypeptidase
MHDFSETLAWIDGQRNRMQSLVTRWASINSGTYNVNGLAKLALELDRDFEVLGGTKRWLELQSQTEIDNCGNPVQHPLGRALHITKPLPQKKSVFLGIHYDTVYGPDDLFQKVDQPGAGTLHGPGVIDAKGGLAVLLIALEAFERSPLVGSLGWEVLINPDEEIGSPGSSPLLSECAKRNLAGLIFEPTLADGSMVDRRKGSGNYSIVVRGRAAHAGRDFAAGRNAVAAAAYMTISAHRINGTFSDMTVNVGRIDGGGAVNVVPDIAIVRLNARASTLEDVAMFESALRKITDGVATLMDVSATFEGNFASMPKLVDEPTTRLKAVIEQSAADLGMKLTWKPSGGASDGNKLAAAGLPVIDTFGPRGGKLHSPEEFLLLDSLTERAKLAVMTMFHLATNPHGIVPNFSSLGTPGEG